MENRLILAQDGDEGYEALFLDGKKIEEGNPINEGTERMKFFLRLSQKHGFNLIDLENMSIKEVDSKTLENWQSFGYLPDNLNSIYFK